MDKNNEISGKTKEDLTNKYGLHKISGKAWGVLQFHKLSTFPFSVFFIVGNEFCERFSYYGMRAVLTLFLLNQLKFNEDSSTAIYHAFIVLCYLLPLLGALIADSCLGKYGTIVSLSIVYAIGNVIVSVSAVPIIRGINIALVGVGLVVIAFGTGGIKPCVAAFGGDQFKESQTVMLRRFFSLFYFSINAGSVISTLLTPVLRNYVQCFGLCECFTLAFGVPAVLMVLSIGIFLIGTRFYIIKKPKKEAARLYFNVPASIAVAIYQRLKIGKESGNKLLQYASYKYSEDFMNDVGLFLRVIVMFLPLPVFWALFDQQGSRWTLQANRMNGKLGKFTIQPDQMQALNPILILLFIPIFESIIYPLFSKCHIFKRPLQRMVVGMLLAGLAFVVAGFVQLKLQSVNESLKSDESKLVMYNNAPFPVDYRIESLSEAQNMSGTVKSGENYVYSVIENGTYDVYFSLPLMNENLFYPLVLNEQNVTQLYITFNSTDLHVIKNEYEEPIPDGTESSIQVVNLVENVSLSDIFISFEGEGSTSSSECKSDVFNSSDLSYGDVSEPKNVAIGRYNYDITTYMHENTSLELDAGIPWLNESSSLEQEFEGGGIYTILVTEVKENASLSNPLIHKLSVIEVEPPNSVSIFLQVPMYVLLTAGEVMFSVTGLEFAYSQAPVSMKAMCQASWLLTVAIGNFVVIIIAESSAFEDRALEFFFFAILIGVVTLVFAIMSYFYKYVNLIDDKDKRSSDKSESTALIPEKNDSVKTSSQYGGELENEDENAPYNSESEF